MSPLEQLLDDRLLKFATHPAVEDGKLYSYREQKECIGNVSVVMLELFSDLFEFPVNVFWRSAGPYVNWESWEADRYIILSSNPDQLLYAQLAYQLFHELGHLAVGYTPETHRERHSNRRNISAWFSETLCTALSYVGLSRLTEQWKNTTETWKRSYSYSFTDIRYENVNSQIRKLGSYPMDVSAYLRKNAVERLQINYNDKTVHGTLAIKIAEIIEEYLQKDIRSLQSLSSVETYTRNNRSERFQFMDFPSWINSLSDEQAKKNLAVAIHGYLNDIDTRLTE